MEQAIEDGIARNYPEEDQNAPRVTIAELLNTPAPAQSTIFGVMGPVSLDM